MLMFVSEKVVRGLKFCDKSYGTNCTVDGGEKISCPPKHIYEPCKCYDGPHPHLVCQNIDDTEVLRDIFIRSSPYWYKEVHIEYSVLQYLPHDMFQGRVFKMIEVWHIENTEVFRGMSWEHLRDFTNLRLLTVYYNSIPSLGSEFSALVSKTLQQLTFFGTGTELVKPGVFGGYNKLDKIALDDCGITQLTRNIFPRPFNGRVLYFNYNKLSSIPDDLFADMPRLQTVGLRENQLLFPAPAFEGSTSKLNS
ncbi:LRRCT domain-containing protein [Caerostris extrusa]|uniref:LRRCT domain-containing protein n=1 Tax=Caerostris extrusa TaxID=172846 RepID=A0AAV4Q677_CAEEX|nr:LRRCT domain-containing protein [Caerostris extrusa]